MRSKRFSLLLLLAIAAACLLGPFVIGQSGEAQNLALGASPPTWQHPFGTDTLGRDQLIRTLEGGRTSLLIGLVATLVACLVGVTYGTLAGWRGGKTEMLMMRAVDVLYALPFTLLVLVLMVAFGQNFILLFVAIGLVEWLTLARIVRARVKELKHTAFIEAARAAGVPALRILCVHVWPNLRGVVAVTLTLMLPSVMLLESFISFLGLGVQEPQTSWGALLAGGARHLETEPWLLFFPALMFSGTLLALNQLGDRS